MLDGPGSSFNDENGYGRGGGTRRPVRKERDDKVHDSIIEERIQRERPCRTLFIRNIKASYHFEILRDSASSACITFPGGKLTEPQYETNSDDVRHQFEEHGEIKTFFDLISTRGMVFVTYVSPARQWLSCVCFKLLTLVLSTTYVLQKEHEKDFRDQKLAVAL